MARTYAIILGSLGFCVLVARGVVGGADVASTVGLACASIPIMAFIGALVGQVAAVTVDDAVRYRFRDQWKQLKAERD